MTATMTWPQLAGHLIATGRMTPKRVTRSAKVRVCRRCSAFTVVGLDGDLCALEATCDPATLSPLGEVLALAEGRRTLHLHRGGGRWELDPRTPDDIASTPAGAGRREDVLAEHRCHQPIPNTWAAPSRFPETDPVTRPTDDTPPPF